MGKIAVVEAVDGQVGDFVVREIENFHRLELK